jgi:hypothetical protein
VTRTRKSNSGVSALQRRAGRYPDGGGSELIGVASV